jgi:hypothetical protein
MKFTTIKEALNYAGGFTSTTKMPCESYDIPIASCNVGSKLRKIKGTICNSCYAGAGNYIRYAKTILPVQHRRLEAISKPFWVAAMAFVINRRKMPFFRLHSSGDIQNLSHFVKICELAKACSNTLIWIPTREYGIVSEYVSMGLEIPKNLIVRLSAYMVDKDGPELLAKKLGVQISTVKKEGFNCPAYKQDNACGNCRKCWDKNAFEISYKLH